MKGLLIILFVAFGSVLRADPSPSPSPDPRTELFSALDPGAGTTNEELKAKFEKIPEKQRAAFLQSLIDNEGGEVPETAKRLLGVLEPSQVKSVLQGLTSQGVTALLDQKSVQDLARLELNRRMGSDIGDLKTKTDELGRRLDDQGRRIGNLEQRAAQPAQAAPSASPQPQNQVANNAAQQTGAGQTGMGQQNDKNQDGQGTQAGAVQTVSTTPGTNIKPGEQPSTEMGIASPGRYQVGAYATWTSPGQIDYSKSIAIFQPSGQFSSGGPRAALLGNTSAASDRNQRAMLPPAYQLSSTASGSTNSSRFILDNHMSGVLGATGESSYQKIYGEDVRQDAISKSSVNGGRSPASATVLETPTTAAGGHKPR